MEHSVLKGKPDCKSFEELLLESGYSLSSMVIPDGDIHRFGKRSHYWYVCTSEWGAAGDWKSELPKVTWRIGQYSNSRLNNKKFYLKRLKKSASEERQKG
jgi:hypothetical protein